MAHAEVVNRWIAQKPHGHSGVPEWESGNMVYRNTMLYSYGWWPIARLMSGKVALVRSDTYSVSTSKHISIARRGLDWAGYRIFTVPCVTHPADHSDNLAHYEYEIGRLLEIADRARVYRDSYMASADRLYREMSDYIDYFRLGDDG